MKLSEIITGRAEWVLATVLVLLLGATGVASRLKLDALPDITPNQVLVLVNAPGLTPDEMERLVTRPVETAIGGLPGLVSQRSITRFGVAMVVAVFDDDVDPLAARQLVSERTANLALPDGVEPPELGPLTGGLGEVFHFALRSPSRSGAELLELANLKVAPILRRIDGVVEVNTWGGSVRTFEVRLDAAKMAARGLDFPAVREAVSASLGAASGASVRAGGGQVLLRGKSRPESITELSRLVIPVVDPAGTRSAIPLADIAVLDEGALPRVGAASGDGKGELVYVMAQMLRGANALELTSAIRGRIDDVRAVLPPDVSVDVIYDRSAMVNRTLLTVAKNLAEGGLLVMLVLFLMLGSLRAGLIVAAVIPASMVFAAVGMVLFDLPGNLMSLGAIDFGLLVDGAVVVVETGFHRPKELAEFGPSWREQVRRVLVGVWRPVLFGVGIIILVYVPILALSGVDGKMFRPMALTVIFALVASLALSLTAVPAAVARFVRVEHVPERAPLLVRLFERVYEPVLELASANPKSVAALAAVLLTAGGVAFANAGTAFVPQLEEGDLVIQTTRAPDIHLDVAVEEAGRLEAALVEHVPEVVQVVSRVGSPAVATDIMGLEQADVFVSLAPREKWRPGLTKEALIEEIDAVIAEHAPGGEPAYTQPIQMRFNEMLGGDVNDVTVSLYGEDLDALRAAGDEVVDRIAGIAGVDDARVMVPPDVSVLEVRPRGLLAGQQGYLAADVLDVVEALEKGLIVGETFVGPRRVPVALKLGGPKHALTLSEAPIPVASGSTLALSSIADVSWSRAPSLVNHEGGERRVVVGFNVRGADLGDVAAAAAERAAEVALPVGTRVEWGGQAETLAAARKRLSVVVPVVLVLIVLVLIIAFGRLRPALIIFSHVPMASVGGVLLLWARGMPISISSAVGFIALSGIAVLNGVVLMQRILDGEAAGLGPREAALEAARSRARPVMMTALVAALGFVPMMLATGMGAEVQRPLATVVVGGLVTSTLLTLVVLPSLYRFFAGRRRGARP